MLARDPALLAEVERRLIDDEEFATSSSARLDFIYRRSQYFDEGLNVHPIGRVEVRPALD